MSTSCYTTSEGRIMVEIKPNVAVCLDVAETTGLIAADIAQRIRIEVAKAERKTATVN